jgi:tRNA A-37 threonylcarbamoyl transferase component Bud32
MRDNLKCKQCGCNLEQDNLQGLCPKCLMKLGVQQTDESVDINVFGKDGGNKDHKAQPVWFELPELSDLAEQFGQLEEIELVGQGGMGVVYRARQKQLERIIALKILPETKAESEAFAERFMREARSLAKLNHPNIVTVYDFGHTESGLYYFIMEFVEGTNLRDVIEAGNLSPGEALAIIPQICEALQYAHQEGIIHRDIKPENILIDKKGRVKIADFGIAKLLDKPDDQFTLTQAGHKMGTPHYMAPEQIEHPHQVDHRADIYSLGVVFYEMLTGELPLGKFEKPSQKVHIDIRLDDVVLRTLEKEPNRRYQHASEVKTEVVTIVTEKGEAKPKAAPNDSTKSSKTSKWLNAETVETHVNIIAYINIAFGALGLLIGIGFCVFFIIMGGVVVDDPEAGRILPIFGGGFLVLFMIMFVPDIIGGIGLLKRKSWSRILVVILSILDLAAIPIGTATGIYSLWVLMNKEAVKLFAKDEAVENVKPV